MGENQNYRLPPTEGVVPLPPATYPKPKRRGRIALVVLAVLLGVGALACLFGVVLSGSPSARPTGAHVAALDATTKPAAGAAGTRATTEPVARPAALTKSDIKLKVKVTDKQCFGSAGCSIEYKIDASVDFSKLDDDASYDVTYEVRGDESGPQIGTLTFLPGGTYEQDGYQSASTSSSRTKLTIKVTDVESNL